MGAVRPHKDPNVHVSREPKYSRFTQQELPACRPVLTPRLVIAIYFALGCLFIPIGAKCLATSRSVVEVSAQYDLECKSAQYYRSGLLCPITLTIPKDMKAPIFIYYQIENMYLNHRRMVLSRSDAQLRGDPNPADSDLATCKPQLYLGGNASLPIMPCGLAAWSYFNDDFSFPAPLVVSTDGLAFKTDLNKRFASKAPITNFNTNASLAGGGTLSTASGAPATTLAQDERFIAWMRTPALSDFRKLWGRLDGVTLSKGQVVTVGVTNNWDSYTFGGKKRIVLSTSTWLGGANHFLGVAYIVVGCVCLGLAVIFAALVAVKGRRLGDPKFYSWNKQHHS